MSRDNNNLTLSVGDFSHQTSSCLTTFTAFCPIKQRRAVFSKSELKVIIGILYSCENLSISFINKLSWDGERAIPLNFQISFFHYLNDLCWIYSINFMDFTLAPKLSASNFAAFKPIKTSFINGVWANCKITPILIFF